MTYAAAYVKPSLWGVGSRRPQIGRRNLLSTMQSEVTKSQSLRLASICLTRRNHGEPPRTSLGIDAIPSPDVLSPRPGFVRCCRQRMRLQPKCAGVDGRINAGVAPPIRFIPTAVDLAIVSSTQWYGVLIADLAPEGPTLGKSEVVGICGSATANETRVLGNRFDVIAVTNSARLWQG